MLTDLGSLAGLRGHSGLERARAQAKAPRKPRPMMQSAAAPMAAPPAAAVSPVPLLQPDPAAQEQGLAGGGMVANDTPGAVGGPYPTLPTSIAPLFTSTPSQGAAFTNLSQIGGNGSTAAPLTRIVTPADIAALFSRNGRPGFSAAVPASLVHLTDPRPAAPSKAPPPAPKVAPADTSVGTAGGSAGDGTAATSDGKDSGGPGSDGSQNDGSQSAGNSGSASSSASSAGSTREAPGERANGSFAQGDPYSSAGHNIGQGAGMAASALGGVTLGGTIGTTFGDVVDAGRYADKNQLASPSLREVLEAGWNNLTSGPFDSWGGFGRSMRDIMIDKAVEANKVGPQLSPQDDVMGYGPNNGKTDAERIADAEQTAAEHANQAAQDQAEGRSNREAAAEADHDHFSAEGSREGDGRSDSDRSDSRDSRDGGPGDGGGDGNARTGGRIDQRMFAGKLHGPGTPTSDSIPTSLPDGRPGPRVSRKEFVVNARTTGRMSDGAALYELQRQSDLHPDLRITPADIAALFRR